MTFLEMPSAKPLPFLPPCPELFSRATNSTRFRGFADDGEGEIDVVDDLSCQDRIGLKEDGFAETRLCD
jgi:hypothetical protein